VEAARSYLALAEALLAGAPPVLVALGGLSGTGKSTVAARLAPRLGGGAGARLLASDRLRKARFGVPPETRLPQSAYAPEVSMQVYGDLTGRSVAVARAGTAVIADAVFARPEERAALAAAAAGAGVRFLGVWLEAPAEVLRARVAARRGGVSDAGVDVLERQLGYDLGPIDWLRLDARRPAAETAAAIEERLAAVSRGAAPCG
jgi:predicted kinase